MTDIHLIYLLWGAGGIAIGAVAAGLIVRMRVRGDYEPRMTASDARIESLSEKLESQAIVAADQAEQVNHWQKASERHQTAVSELNAAMASMETRVKQIPVLEGDLAAARKQVQALQNDLRQESAALAQALEKGRQLSRLETDKARHEEQIGTMQTQAANHQAQIAELSTALEEERKQAAEKIALLNEARDQLKSEFQNLAQKIFDDKSAKFTEQNSSNIDHLLRPLRDQISDFKKRVEDVYDKETRDRTALQTEIHHLKELNQRISKEALNLTRALKGDSKARGNWGEVILERVLEASGLQKGREYDVQISLKDADGRRYQPDVIVRLPQEKDVVVDAKVSLKDYEAYFSADEIQEKETFLKAHIESLRTHVRSLAAKSYEELEGVRSLDFVLMFIPIEAAFLAAVEHDRDLFGEAFDKNIILVSPSTLLVTLRTIENIWRHEYQNRYALEIAKKAGAMHDKFVLFVEALEDVGQQLDRAKDAYRLAADRLSKGRGNLIRRTQELKQLGVKAGKELPSGLIELSEQDLSE